MKHTVFISGRPNNMFHVKHVNNAVYNGAESLGKPVSNFSTSDVITRKLKSALQATWVFQNDLQQIDKAGRLTIRHPPFSKLGTPSQVAHLVEEL